MEGAYDLHVPYVPLLEAYVRENVTHTRFIGISYGHQVIAWALNPGGGNVVKNPNGWENAAVETSLTDEGRRALRTEKTVSGMRPFRAWPTRRLLLHLRGSHTNV